MRFSRTLSISLCIALSAGFAIAQDSVSTPPTLEKCEPVISHIPAGAMGFISVNSIQNTAANAEKFLQEIGVAAMLGLPPEQTGVLVDMLKALQAFYPMKKRSSF